MDRNDEETDEKLHFFMHLCRYAMLLPIEIADEKTHPVQSVHAIPLPPHSPSIILSGFSLTCQHNMMIH
jgi:hypothetical protein